MPEERLAPWGCKALLGYPAACLSSLMNESRSAAVNAHEDAFGRDATRSITTVAVCWSYVTRPASILAEQPAPGPFYHSWYNDPVLDGAGRETGETTPVVQPYEGGAARSMRFQGE